MIWPTRHRTSRPRSNSRTPGPPTPTRSQTPTTRESIRRQRCTDQSRERFRQQGDASGYERGPDLSKVFAIAADHSDNDATPDKNPWSPHGDWRCDLYRYRWLAGTAHTDVDVVASGKDGCESEANQ